MKSVEKSIMHIKSFEPIVDENSKVLILGTAPGGESLRTKKYYADSSNDFWLFIHFIIKENIYADYELKKQQLLKNKIAIWDVLKECDREKSSDNKITNPVPHGFNIFYETYPNIQAVFFNGSKAMKYYKKLVGFSSNKLFYELPSSSNAPGKNVKTLEEKKKDWLLIQQHLKK